MTESVAGAWAQEGRTPRIAVIGAGFSGLGAIIKLREAGYTDVTCFERADKLGGTWRDNTYPGLSCDIPSHWYSYSFAPNPDWPHRFSHGPDIWAYQEKIAKDYDLYKDIRFEDAVTELRYIGPQWQLNSEKSGQQLFDFVIAATGVLVNPSYPDIAGLDSFSGDSFHSARWNHDIDLRGKRVGVIGTGSTSCQIVGAVAEEVEQLHVFQRTPHWVHPMRQKAYSSLWQTILRQLPFVQRLARLAIRTLIEATIGKATSGNLFAQSMIERSCRKALETHVTDPDLRAKLTPDYMATCKRLILSDDYYPALMRDNVELVTEGITAIEPNGVRCADGELKELDVLVLATGFKVNDFILPTQVYGEQGQSLQDFWHGLPRAHRALCFPGFPNFMMMEGPTGVFGNTCLIDVTEHQLIYVIDTLNKMRDDKLAAIAPQQSAFETYNTTMAKAIDKTIWAVGGCDSWYLDASGKPNLYPWMPGRYREEMKNIDFSEYRLMQNLE